MGAKMSRCFSFSPAQNSMCFSLSGWLLVELWWCFKRQGPQTCWFGVPSLVGPPGFHTMGHWPSKTPPKFNEKTPSQREKYMIFLAAPSCPFWVVRSRCLPPRLQEIRLSGTMAHIDDPHEKAFGPTETHTVREQDRQANIAN